MSRLIIERLRLANFGAIREEVDLGPFHPGVTLIVGPNETGKSTVVEALRCALFERHRTQHQGIKGLVPHGGLGEPEVWLTFRHGDDRLHIHKRFMKRVLSELRRERPGVPDQTWSGDEADAELWRVLGAEPPGRGRGAGHSDLGAWGLLWVRQDDAAAKDPGAGAESRAREAITDAVGRQVNQALGGGGAEALMARITETCSLYFTDRSQKATGPLREAELAVAQLETEVARLDQAVRATEKLAEDRKDREAQRAANQRGLAHVQHHLRLAEARAERAQAAAEVTHRAETEHARAEAHRDTAARTLALRAEQTAALAAAETKATEASAHARDLGETVRAAAASTQGAAERLEAARAHLRHAREADAAARRGLTAARRHADAARLRDTLAEARRLAQEIDGLRAAVAAAPDDAALASLDQAWQALQAADARFEREATRLELGPPETPTLRWRAGQPGTRAVAGWGPLGLSPSAAGLPEARRARAEAEQRLAERLDAAGQPSLEAARAARAARAATEAEAAQLADQLKAEAPEGLGRLSTQAAEAQARHQTAEAALAEARTLEQRAAAAAAILAAEPVDDATLARLEALDRARESARSRRAATVTRVEVAATADFALQVEAPTEADSAGDAEPRRPGPPPQPLAAGERTALDLAHPQTLVIGALARVTITPSGTDAAVAEAALGRAEAVLTEALEAVSAADLEAARARAEARRRAAAEAELLRQRLAQTAGAGLEALAREVAELARKAESWRGREARALAAATRSEALKRRLESAPVTAEVWGRLEAAATAASEAVHAEGRLAATVRWPDGQTILATEATAGTCDSPLGAVPWRLVPGLGGAEAEAALAESARRLDHLLDRSVGAAGSTSAAADALDHDDESAQRLRAERVEVARRRWQEGAVERARLNDRTRALAALVPQGLAALEAACAADDAEVAGAEVGQGDPARAPPEVAEAHAQEVAAALAAASEAHEVAQAALDDARALQAALQTEHAARAATAEAATSERRRLEARLSAEREAAADAELEMRAAEAERARADAEQRLSAARAHLAQEGGDEAAAEVRAQREAEANLRESDARLRAQLAVIDAQLKAAAVEGRFEQRAEAEAELERAREAKVRVSREAAAALRLLTVTQRHYEETQTRFLAPVIQEVAPYLQKLRPGSRLKMQPDLRVAEVERDGAHEQFDQLSGGTREQLAVIVRVALARVLARDGRAMPLILDDIMGWTDDGRFDRMMAILKNASTQLQIIVLTCHPERFVRLGAGRTIDLEHLRAEARLAEMLTLPADDRGRVRRLRAEPEEVP